jgi:hypothetical protein
MSSLRGRKWLKERTGAAYARFTRSSFMSTNRRRGSRPIPGPANEILVAPVGKRGIFTSFRNEQARSAFLGLHVPGEEGNDPEGPLVSSQTHRLRENPIGSTKLQDGLEFLDGVGPSPAPHPELVIPRHEENVAKAFFQRPERFLQSTHVVGDVPRQEQRILVMAGRGQPAKPFPVGSVVDVNVRKSVNPHLDSDRGSAHLHIRADRKSTANAREPRN